MMITVYAGPVKAGKSKKLIEIYKQLENCGVMVFSSKMSLTHGEDVVSRYGTTLKAIPINSLWDIPHHIPAHRKVFYILIDEFQFLQMTPKEVQEFFIKYGFSMNFYIFGLDRDYKLDTFSLMDKALGMADSVEKLGGYCDLCSKIPSKYSLRLEDGKPANINDKNAEVILLDGEHNDVEISYKSICPECYEKIYFGKECNV